MKIGLWWKFEGRYYWYNLKNGIKNLWKWFPVVWSDRNFGYNYTLKVLKFKLENQANYIEKNKRFVGWEYTVRDIRLCVSLLEKMRDDFYDSEYMDYHNSTFDFIPCDDNPKQSWLNIETVEENFADYFAKYPIIYKKVMNGEGVFSLEGREDDLKVIAMNIAHINHSRCRKLLFKILEQKIERWWD